MKLLTYDYITNYCCLKPEPCSEDLFIHIMGEFGLLVNSKKLVDRFIKTVELHGQKVESINGYPLTRKLVIGVNNPLPETQWKKGHESDILQDNPLLHEIQWKSCESQYTITLTEAARQLGKSREWIQKKVCSMTEDKRNKLGIYKNSSGWQIPVSSVVNIK